MNIIYIIYKYINYIYDWVPPTKILIGSIPTPTLLTWVISLVFCLQLHLDVGNRKYIYSGLNKKRIIFSHNKKCGVGGFGSAVRQCRGYTVWFPWSFPSQMQRICCHEPSSPTAGKETGKRSMPTFKQLPVKTSAYVSWVWTRLQGRIYSRRGQEEDIGKGWE